MWRARMAVSAKSENTASTPSSIELQIFQHRIVPIIGSEENRLVAKRVRVQGKPRCVGVGHEARWRLKLCVGSGRHDAALIRANGARITCNLREPSRRHQVAIGPRIASGDEIEGLTLGFIQQLNQWDRREFSQFLQVLHFERLDEHRRVRLVIAVCSERGHERRLKRKTDRTKIAGMLGFRIDADHPARLAARTARDVDDLLEGRNFINAVPALVAKRQPLLGAQRLDFRQRKILGKESLDRASIDRLRRPSPGKFFSRVSRRRDVVFVPCDQHAVLRRHQVGLDEIRAVRDREFV